MPDRFIPMDTALLARQSEQLDELNTSIQKLAKALEDRPTKEEIAFQRRRQHVRTGCLVLVAAMLFSGLYWQNHKVTVACHDRNDNSARFRTLLLVVLEPDPEAPSPPVNDAHSKKVVKAFQDYTDSLKPINC